jgi:hypothetical protein
VVKDVTFQILLYTRIIWKLKGKAAKIETTFFMTILQAIYMYISNSIEEENKFLIYTTKKVPHTIWPVLLLTQ